MECAFILFMYMYGFSNQSMCSYYITVSL